ncbi:MAG: YkgJ family cysteine cluster protein, partial [Desulfobacteraceae bacterium]
MESKFTAISRDEKFQFTCDPKVSCFNACCHNLYQVLTPYDVLRLKSFLGLTSGEFIEKYTNQAIGPETGLPVVSLRPEPTRDMACPFVTAKGCVVYAARPASCRMYPLARAVTRCRETGRISEHYALLQEAHCCGFGRGRQQSVDQWLSDQILEDYNIMNDLFLEIITLKNRFKPGPLDLVSRQVFHMAMYDSDGFYEYLKQDDMSNEVP